MVDSTAELLEGINSGEIVGQVDQAVGQVLGIRIKRPEYERGRVGFEVVDGQRFGGKIFKQENLKSGETGDNPLEVFTNSYERGRSSCRDEEFRQRVIDEDKTYVTAGLSFRAAFMAIQTEAERLIPQLAEQQIDSAIARQKAFLEAEIAELRGRSQTTAQELEKLKQLRDEAERLLNQAREKKQKLDSQVEEAGKATSSLIEKGMGEEEGKKIAEKVGTVKVMEETGGKFGIGKKVEIVENPFSEFDNAIIESLRKIGFTPGAILDPESPPTLKEPEILLQAVEEVINNFYLQRENSEYKSSPDKMMSDIKGLTGFIAEKYGLSIKEDYFANQIQKIKDPEAKTKTCLSLLTKLLAVVAVTDGQEVFGDPGLHISLVIKSSGNWVHLAGEVKKTYEAKLREKDTYHKYVQVYQSAEGDYRKKAKEVEEKEVEKKAHDDRITEEQEEIKVFENKRQELVANVALETKKALFGLSKETGITFPSSGKLRREMEEGVYDWLKNLGGENWAKTREEIAKAIVAANGFPQDLEEILALSLRNADGYQVRSLSRGESFDLPNQNIEIYGDWHEIFTRKLTSALEGEIFLPSCISVEEINQFIEEKTVDELQSHLGRFYQWCLGQIPSGSDRFVGSVLTPEVLEGVQVGKRGKAEVVGHDLTIRRKKENEQSESVTIYFKEMVSSGNEGSIVIIKEGEQYKIRVDDQGAIIGQELANSPWENLPWEKQLKLGNYLFGRGAKIGLCSRSSYGELPRRVIFFPASS